MNYFVVIGIGAFGNQLIHTLADKGKKIVATDKDPLKVDSIKDIVDKAVVSDITNVETLENIGTKDADGVIVATGPEMEDSILIVHFLKEMGVKKIIAKANSEAHSKILKLIGADVVVLPERDSAIRLAMHLIDENILDNLPFSGGFSIRKIIPPDRFIGKSIKDLDVRNKFGVNIIAIKESLPKDNLIIPKADHVITSSDYLIISGEEKTLDNFSKS